MALITYSELREKAREAIASILDNGQEVSWNGQKYTKADLSQLIESERQLTKIVEAEEQASSRTRWSGRVRYRTRSDC